jgi:hypothetical protein
MDFNPCEERRDEVMRHAILISDREDGGTASNKGNIWPDWLPLPPQLIPLRPDDNLDCNICSSVTIFPAMRVLVTFHDVMVMGEDEAMIQAPTRNDCYDRTCQLDFEPHTSSSCVLLSGRLLRLKDKDFSTHRVPIDLSMEVTPEMEQVIRRGRWDFKAERDSLTRVNPQTTGRMGVDQCGSTRKLEIHVLE